jgi:hypothetical protein
LVAAPPPALSRRRAAGPDHRLYGRRRGLQSRDPEPFLFFFFCLSHTAAAARGDLPLLPSMPARDAAAGSSPAAPALPPFAFFLLPFFPSLARSMNRGLLMASRERWWRRRRSPRRRACSPSAEHASVERTGRQCPCPQVRERFARRLCLAAMVTAEVSPAASLLLLVLGFEIYLTFSIRDRCTSCSVPCSVDSQTNPSLSQSAH